MSSRIQNHGLMLFMFINRLVRDKMIELDEHDPRIMRLGNLPSGYFLCGRDENDEPFLGVPSEMMPWFTQVDWVGAALCRKEGYLYLEGRDSSTQVLLMSLGIKVRTKRLNVFSIEGHEDIDMMSLNMKVFERDEKDNKQVYFADHHEVIGIPLQEIDTCHDLSSEEDAEEARKILAKSGLDRTFSPTKVVGA